MPSVAFLGFQNAPKSLAAEASLQTAMGQLTAHPQTPSGVLDGLRLRPLLLEGGEERGGESAKMIYATGARNLRAVTGVCSMLLDPCETTYMATDRTPFG